MRLYFVETRVNEQRLLLCHLTEHFYEAGRRIQVLTDSSMAAQHLDQMLWSFSQESFIPHRIFTSDPSESFFEPVLITVGEKELPERPDFLICDGAASVEFLSRYPSAIHFVLMDDAQRRQESRLLWQTARDQGIELRHIPYAPIPKVPVLMEKLEQQI